MDSNIRTFWDRVLTPEGFVEAIDEVWNNLDRDKTDYFGALVFSAAPPTFSALEVVQEYYLVDDALRFWQQLRDLNWYAYFEDSARYVLHQKARAFVVSACSGNYETAIYTGVIVPWRDSIVATWLLDCQAMVKVLDVVIRESYVDARLWEMYEILADFPESETAVLELRDILSTTRKDLVVADSITSVLKKRVLHAGANTSQILDVYAAAVGLLRLVDDRDMLPHGSCPLAKSPSSIEIVASPVRAYLRKRADTVRCIVKHITESSGQAELISMLVSIFGSRDVFANEYRVMLAEKLLKSSKVGNVDNELEILELLKLRFRDLSFQQCEVMLRDVEDSARLNRKKGSPPAFAAIVISHVFWPALLFPQRHLVSLHRRLVKLMNVFSEKYNRSKAPRKLQWMPLQGSVKLELKGTAEEFSKAIMLTVSPFVASLILFFDGEDSVTLQDLASKSNVSEIVVRRKMTKWINLGILQEAKSGVYKVNMSQPRRHNNNVVSQRSSQDFVDDDDMATGPPCKKQHTSKVPYASSPTCLDHKVYISYILGMLGNLGELSEDSIHNMLKMFANEDQKYALSKSDLHQLLLKLCQDEAIEQQPADGAFFRLFQPEKNAQKSAT